MIALIDYGMGNLGSVSNALSYLGARYQVTSDPEVIGAAEGVILPGVGAFRDCMANLRDYGLVEVIREVIAQERPFLGICLGLQAIGVAYGAVVGRAPELLHGKTSPVHHDGRGVFAGLPNPITATRYHSLAIDPGTLPDELEVSARTESGTIMAVRHRRLPIEAVQFHPESVLTEGGYQMLGNWLAACGDADAPARAAGLSPLIRTRRPPTS